jgi:5-oxoprolinase (ATP-hydrolysing)
MSVARGGFRFAIDRGGTFTDLFCELPDGTAVTRKLLSVDPANYADAPTEGIRRVLEEFTGAPLAAGIAFS